LGGIAVGNSASGEVSRMFILFNSLPLSIKEVAHIINKFKYELRKFLMENSFYSVEEYIDRNSKLDLGVSQ
jgi:hypothetical protein